MVPLDKLSVVFTILLSFLILKEPLSPKVIAGGLLIMLGALILTRNESVLSHYGSADFSGGRGKMSRV